MPYDLNAIRQNIRKAVSGKFSDPDEFKPEKSNSTTEAIKYRFYVLPPLLKGDVLKTGTVNGSMDNFFMRHGNHWINGKPNPCPRIYDGSECAICNYGFDLLKECKEKKFSEERKKQILDSWMPSPYYMVNIFFTNWKGNPEELRGKVKYYNAPKTCIDKWTLTLLRDDAGDVEDPEAFGVFYDEEAAFCFELVVLKEGRTNGYKTSSFLKNNGIPSPMIANPDGSPNRKALDLLLKSRIDLFSKVEVPDSSKIARLADMMINGDDAAEDKPSGGFDSDEEDAAVAETHPKTKSAKSTQAHSPKKEETFAFMEEAGEVEEPKASKPAAKKPAPKVEEESVSSDEIDDLLSQLDD